VIKLSSAEQGGIIFNQSGQYEWFIHSIKYFFGSVCMKEATVMVNNKVGLHTRPASLFVQAAAKFASNIQVSCKDPETKELREANAKSILGVLTLGVFQGMDITIQAEGEDEETAVTTLAELVKNNFGEE
jgi:phosphocarrier protein